MSDELQAVVAAIEAGDIGRARFLLRPLLANPSADILFVASKVAPNKDDAKKRLLEALALDPQHEEAKAELAKVEVTQAKVYLPGGITVEEIWMQSFEPMALFGNLGLPSLPEGILQRAYRPSGKCSPVYFALIGAVALPTAVLIGYAVHQICQAILSAVSMANATTYVDFVQSETYVLLVIGFMGLFGFLGWILSYGFWWLAKVGKCRSVGLATSLSLISAIICYSAFIAFAVQDRDIYPLTNLDLTQWWLYAVVVLGGLTFVAVSIRIVRRRVQETPFSEATGEWYRANWQWARIPVSAAPALVQALMTGSTDGIGLSMLAMFGVISDQSLEIKLRGHPSSKQEDYQIRVTEFWVEYTTTNTSEEASPSEAHELWFDVMIPSRVGQQIESALFRIDQLI